MRRLWIGLLLIAGCKTAPTPGAAVRNAYYGTALTVPAGFVAATALPLDPNAEPLVDPVALLAAYRDTTHPNAPAALTLTVFDLGLDPGVRTLGGYDSARVSPEIEGYNPPAGSVERTTLADGVRRIRYRGAVGGRSGTTSVQAVEYLIPKAHLVYRLTFTAATDRFDDLAGDLLDDVGSRLTINSDAPAIQESLADQTTLVPRAAVRAYETGVRSLALDTTEAVAKLAEALQLAPQYAMPYNARSLLSWLRGDLSGAAADRRTALRFKPNYALARYNLAVVLTARDSTDAANELFETVVQQQPRAADAWTNLGAIRFERGDFVGAEAAYRITAELRPGDPVALRNLGLALARRGRFADAIPLYRRAADLSPGDVNTMTALAAIYRAANMPDSARVAEQEANRRAAPVVRFDAPTPDVPLP